MSTDKQLFESWISQHILGISDSQYYCNDYSSSRETAKEDDASNDEGTSIGTIAYNPKTNKLKVKFDKAS